MAFGDSFGWAFRDPQWGRKLILQGLIGLIPIVGQIAALGWVMQCLDNLRSGRQQMAEPGFPLGRGINAWLPLFVLSLIAGIVPRILTGIGGGLTASSSGSGGAAVAGGILIGVGDLLATLLGFGTVFLLVPLLATAYEHGMGAAFNYPEVIRRATQSPVASLLGIVATFIAGVGSVLCYFGLFLTYGYGMSIIAGLLTNLVPGLAPPAGAPGYGPAGGYPPNPYPAQQPGGCGPPPGSPYGQPAYGAPPASPYGPPPGGYGPPPGTPYGQSGYGQSGPSPYGGQAQQYPPGAGQPGSPQYPVQPPSQEPGYPPPPGPDVPPASRPPAPPPAPPEEGEQGKDDPTGFGPQSPTPPDEPPAR